MSKLKPYPTIALSILLLAIVVSSTILNAEIVVQDAIGRTISINKQPARVVSLAPSITEIMAYLEELDKIVGADSMSLSDTWFNISSVLSQQNTTDVGGYWWSALKSEEILSLSPDLVLADRGAHTPLLDFFRSYNITVVYLSGGAASSVEDVVNDIYIVAKIFNKTDEAGRFSLELSNEFTKYRGLILRGYNGTRVLYVVSLSGGIWVAGKGTYIDDILERLGLSNACYNTYSWTPVSIEKIHEFNPDVIIIGSMEPDIDSLINQTGLRSLGKPIVVLNSTETDILSRPGPLLLYAPQVIYRALANANITSSTREEVGRYSASDIYYVAVIVVILVILVIALLYVKKSGRRT